MPREKEDFRDNLCRVTERFPDQELIPVKDAAAFLGGISPRRLYEVKNTPCKRVGGRWYITAVALARWLSQ
jgi:hypothetical protein